MSARRNASGTAILDALGCRTGRATFSFTSLDDELAADLTALLDRLLERYRAERTS